MRSYNAERNGRSQQTTGTNDNRRQITIEDGSLEGVGIHPGDEVTIELQPIHREDLRYHRGELLCFADGAGGIVVGRCAYPYIELPYREITLRIGMSDRRVVGVVKNTNRSEQNE